MKIMILVKMEIIINNNNTKIIHLIQNTNTKTIKIRVITLKNLIKIKMQINIKWKNHTITV